MKRFSFLLVFTTMTFLSFGLAHGATEIVLESVTNLLGGDTVEAGKPIRFTLRYTYSPGLPDTNVTGITNAFQIYTAKSKADPSTVYFDPITSDTIAIGWSDMMDAGIFVIPFGADGKGYDTASLGAFSISKPGFQPGFDQTVFWIETGNLQAGDTVCLGSCTNYPPTNIWAWALTPDDIVNRPNGIAPDWGGPYCFHVYDPSTDVKELGGPDLPTTYALSQNYPNPFNPITEISFDIPVRSRVTLTVFNVVGQKVTTLIDKELAPNRYVVDWDGTTDDGTKVASGVYFYKLEAGDFVETKKMMFLK